MGDHFRGKEELGDTFVLWGETLKAFSVLHRSTEDLG